MDKKNGCALTNYQLPAIKVDNGNGHMTEESKPDTDSTCIGFAIVEDKEELSYFINDEETEDIELDPLDLDAADDSSPELVIFFDEEVEEKGLELVPLEQLLQDTPAQICNKESIPTNMSNKITSDRMASLKETSSYEISDIQQMLAELEQLEEKENQKRINFADSGKIYYPTTFSARPKESVPADSERSEFLELFIEMKFLEGIDLLLSGDRFEAIDRFRNAVNYAPHDAKFYIKLAEVLSEDNSTLVEAEKWLSIAFSKEPNNMELRSRLFELKERKSEVKSKKSDTESPTSQRVFIGVERSTLKTKVSLRNKLIITAFLSLSVLGLILGLINEPPKKQIKLLYPANEAIVPHQRLKLDWQGLADLYVIEVSDGNEKIIEKATGNTEYIFSAEDRTLFKPGHSYTWRVKPKNIHGEELPYKIDEFQFTVVSPPKRR